MNRDPSAHPGQPASRRFSAAAGAAALAAALGAPAARAADAPAPPPSQRGGTFIEPPSSVDAAYLPSAPNAQAPQGLDALQLRLSARISAQLPLRSSRPSSGARTQGSQTRSPTLQLDLRLLPLPDSYWFVQGTFYRYLHPGAQQTWNPDLSYAFGYDDWHPGTFSLVYANYTGTRLEPDRSRGESRSNFDQGQWSLGYKFELPQPLVPLFLVGDGDQALCNARLALTPRYVENAGGSLRSNKKSVSLGCRYTRPSGWFADLAVFAYPERGQQQPWDPDYTYGFGYFDWRPGTLSIQYSNYSGNRFPGRARTPGEGTLRDASLSFSWRAQW